MIYLALPRRSIFVSFSPPQTCFSLVLPFLHIFKGKHKVVFAQNENKEIALFRVVTN